MTEMTVVHGFVSTHSRPKAAGPWPKPPIKSKLSFNTQPPEGGWLSISLLIQKDLKFQHTAARRRLAFSDFFI